MLERVQALLAALQPVTVDLVGKQEIVRLIDWTRLQETDDAAQLDGFFSKARTPFGDVAAVCIYPKFIPLAQSAFVHTAVKVAAVANFPHGLRPVKEVLLEINQAIEQGAQEIDVVFPYQNFLAGHIQAASVFVASCKAACGSSVTLKVILETCRLKTLQTIADAAKLVLDAGADFVKTSTGKAEQGATLEAAGVLLQVVQDHFQGCAGVKVSGGIRRVEQAAQYVELARLVMGTAWVKPHAFRIGCSQLENLMD